jgi:hypothetical protein
VIKKAAAGYTLSLLAFLSLIALGVALSLLDSTFAQATLGAAVVYFLVVGVVLIVLLLPKDIKFKVVTYFSYKQNEITPPFESRSGNNIGQNATFRPPLRGITIWGLLFAMVVAWEFLALFTPPDKAHLTISALSLHYQIFHMIAFFVWAAAGVGLICI